MSYGYTQCGLRIRSEIELPLPLVSDDASDVVVRWGPDIGDSHERPPGDVIAVYEADGTRWYTATSTGSGFLIRFRDCGEFVISSDLTEVVIRRDPAGRVELLPILMAGTVSAFVLALRGHTVLHASAVALDGSALAFVGQSGRGKSTIAALLCAEGAGLVTDDVLTIDPGPPAMCTGGAAEVRLRSSAFEIAHSHHASATRVTADDRLAYAPGIVAAVPVPLAGIVIPSPSRTATEVEVRVLPPSMALFALLAFPRVHGWSRAEVLTRDFSALSLLVNEVPVYDVTIPWGPPFTAEVGASLRRLLVSGPPLIDDQNTV